MRFAKPLTYIGLISIAILGSGCATISEDQCLAGNWEDRGYRDGIDGRARSRLMSYVDTCGEFGAIVDRSAYLSGFETGLTYYCVPEQGFKLGRNGNSYNTVCSGEMADGFRAAYSDGRILYEIEREHQGLVSALAESGTHIEDVVYRLKHESMSDKDYLRLRAKLDRLKAEQAQLREALYQFELTHQF